VWKYFGFVQKESEEIRSKNKDSTVCRICDATLKYNDNTTNMAKHIEGILVGRGNCH
jgi:hypothetical protein